MDLVYRPVIAIARALFAVEGLRFTLTGTEHVPRSGGAVLALNHTAYPDFLYAGYAALPRRRLVRFMAKQSVFEHPVSGPLMRGMRHIPVDRAAGGAAYRKAVTALRAGEIVGVYPEATISRSFELKDFKAGAARMAQEAGVPILPCIVWGAQRVWTKDHPKRLGRTGIPISVDIGAPLTVAPGEDVHAATARLKEVMGRQLDAVAAAYPPVPPQELVFIPKRFGGQAPTLAEAEELHRQELARRAARRALAPPQPSGRPHAPGDGAPGQRAAGEGAPGDTGAVGER